MWLSHHPVKAKPVLREEHNNALGHDDMDHIRPKAIAIPLETWIAQRENAMERYGRHELHHVGLYPVLKASIQRIGSSLQLAHRTLTKLIHGQ